MSKTVLYMSVSLDGFIAGPDVTLENGLGVRGERLHEWVMAPEGGEGNSQIYSEFMSTGSIVAGSGTFEPAEGWGGDHHDGVPIWVLSRHAAPAWASSWSNVTYLNDIELAFADAREAAGDKDVLVHGSSTAQRAIRAGLLDQMELHVIPVLLGEGRRLFEQLGADHRELRRIRVLQGGGDVTHLRYAFKQ